MKKLSIPCLVLSILVSQSLFSSVLVLEYFDPNDEGLHGELVTDVACPVSHHDCQIIYFGSDNFTNPLPILSQREGLPSPYDKVVNMSFGFQKPHASLIPPHAPGYPKALEEYKSAISRHQTNKSVLESLFTFHPNTLFVAAAGNGKSLDFGLETEGIGVDPSDEIFPAAWEHSNLIKVAAANISEIDPIHPEDYSLESYSNFGLTTTDIAAPVPFHKSGTRYNGTSFSAPYISRLVDDILEEVPELMPSQLKGILTRSCHVKGLSKAMSLTLDMDRDPKSKLHLAQYSRSLKKRQELQKEFTDVILVRCGGVVLKEVALSCAKILHEASTLTLDQACLRAHRNVRRLDESRLQSLKEFWNMRKL